ncbi:MAG: sodium:solute symporter [Saprospiraceae bacterium]|nr:sodium:solute symporter [Saprospiraceae bacterium]
MNRIDWIILFCTLSFIVIYGVWKTRHAGREMEGFLVGNRQMQWWVVGLSIMATQASAITFLSTPGQAYEDGMRFLQFYFGLPIAMIILSVAVIPIYYKLKIYTAYEYLESRFDLKTRTLTALLFLIQRGLAAGLTLYAPAIILSTILGWDLSKIIGIIGALVVIYVTVGGSAAVSQTHKQQMAVIWFGMLSAFVVLLLKLPDGITFSKAVTIAQTAGKMNILDFKFDLSTRYNVWSGIIGGTFLFLSYFGTDQSQVGRYLSGLSEKEAKMGLLMNGILKIPMQFIILFIGVMVYVFFQFYPSPLHFNKQNVAEVNQSNYAAPYQKTASDLLELQTEKRNLLLQLTNPTPPTNWEQRLTTLTNQENFLRSKAKEYIIQANPKADTEDTDYVFISFILQFLPHGLIGLLIAVIFSAAMSSISAEINALASTLMIDIYKRSLVKDKSPAHYLLMSKVFTVLWGVLALCFAMLASLFENLIEAVNIVGSIFYGTILGIFLVGFFMKQIKGNAVFIAALIAEILVINIFILDRIGIMKIAYLWLNMIGCLLVIVLSSFIQQLLPKEEN